MCSSLKQWRQIEKVCVCACVCVRESFLFLGRVCVCCLSVSDRRRDCVCVCVCVCIQHLQSLMAVSSKVGYLTGLLSSEAYLSMCVYLSMWYIISNCVCVCEREREREKERERESKGTCVYFVNLFPHFISICFLLLLLLQKMFLVAIVVNSKYFSQIRTSYSHYIYVVYLRSDWVQNHDINLKYIIRWRYLCQWHLNREASAVTTRPGTLFTNPSKQIPRYVNKLVCLNSL